MRHRILSTLALVALAIGSIVGCSGDVRDLTFGEFEELSAEQKQEFAREISAEELQAILRASLRHAFEDTTALNAMTLRELIAEGRQIGAEEAATAAGGDE